MECPEPTPADSGHSMNLTNYYPQPDIIFRLPPNIINPSESIYTQLSHVEGVQELQGVQEFRQYFTPL